MKRLEFEFSICKFLENVNLINDNICFGKFENKYLDRKQNNKYLERAILKIINLTVVKSCNFEKRN